MTPPDLSPATDERAFALDIEDGQADGCPDYAAMQREVMPENHPIADEFATGDPDDAYEDWWL